MTQTTVRSTLGIWWVYIHDILYFTAYTVFRILLTGNSLIDGMQGTVYLMTGLVPWLLISEILNSATNAIRNNKVIIQSIRFPIILLPTVDVLAINMKRVLTFLFIFATCIYYGYGLNVNLFLVIYYFIAMNFLLLGLTHLISAFVAISNDFYQFYVAIMKIVFFSLPIMWSFSKIESTSYSYLASLIKLNPLVYIIEGFRDAFVSGGFQTLKYTIYFWSVAWIIFMLGCYVQYKLAKYYSDFI